MARVVPSLTAETPDQYGSQMEKVKPFAKRIHVDTCDGLFTPHRLIGLAQVYDIPGVPMDLHLMVVDPTSQLETAISLHPSIVIVHFESEGDLPKLFARLRDCGIKAGLAINSDTDVEAVQELLPKVDHLLIFTGGNLGYYGGGFQAQCLDKIADARKTKPDLEISVDGGVDPGSAKLAAAAGADILTCGSYIQKSSDPARAFIAVSAAAGGGE